MAGRQTAIGKVLADIDGKIAKLEYAGEVLASMTPEGLASDLASLKASRALVASHDTPRATNGAPKPRKARTKKPKTAQEEK